METVQRVTEELDLNGTEETDIDDQSELGTSAGERVLSDESYDWSSDTKRAALDSRKSFESVEAENSNEQVRRTPDSTSGTVASVCTHDHRNFKETTL